MPLADIIPLTKKLKDCGVFGVSSDEYLNYALQNRKEWTKKGQTVVDEMLAQLDEKYNSTPKQKHGSMLNSRSAQLLGLEEDCA